MTSPNRSSFLEWSYQAESPLKTLWKWADCHPVRILWLTLLYTVKALPNWSIPLAVGFLIDAVTETPDSWMRFWPLIALQFILIAQNIPIHMLFASQLSRISRRLENRLRRALVTRLQQLSIPFHDNSESGELQAKILRDVEQVQVLARAAGEQGITFSLSFIAVLLITLSKQPLVLLVYVVLVPMCILITRAFKGRMQIENRNFRKNLESMNSEVTQMIEMIPVSRAHGIEDEAIHKVEARIHRIGETGYRLDKVQSLFASTNWVAF
jgi:ATP-binding cassette subfamily B protein